MKSYRKKLKIRIVYSIIIAVIMISVMIIFNNGLISTPKEVMGEGFFRSFINSMCAASVTMLVFKIFHYASILRNHDKLRTEYIKENDELTKSIVSEIGTNEYYFIVTGLALGMVIGGYVNMYVFWTFYISLMYYCIVRSILKMIYQFKYKSIGDNEE